MLQTHQRALLGANGFLKYLQTNLIDEFGKTIDVAGVLPVLSKGQLIIHFITALDILVQDQNKQ